MMPLWLVNVVEMHLDCVCGSRYWNKFYTGESCVLESCYGGEERLEYKPGPVHQAQKKEVVDGELRYTYSVTRPTEKRKCKPPS